MSYDVYTAEFHGARNHVRLFVETAEDGSGLIFHVIGNVLNGMQYEKRAGNRPDDSAAYVQGSKIRIGSIAISDLARFEAACESIPVPGAQLNLNGTPKDPSKPVRRCGDWVREAKDKVIADGIVRT